MVCLLGRCQAVPQDSAAADLTAQCLSPPWNSLGLRPLAHCRFPLFTLLFPIWLAAVHLMTVAVLFVFFDGPKGMNMCLKNPNGEGDEDEFATCFAKPKRCGFVTNSEGIPKPEHLENYVCGEFEKWVVAKIGKLG